MSDKLPAHPQEGADRKHPPARKWKLRLPYYWEVNRWFTFGCFVSPPVLGSVTSFLFNGGALWCLFETISGRSPLTRERHVWLITAALWAYCLVAFVSAWANGILRESFGELIGLFTLAAFPFSYSIWSISIKREIVYACVLAAGIACYSALGLTLFQRLILLEQRVEGGAGNAYVFAVATTLSFAIALTGAVRFKGKLALFLTGGLFAAATAVLYSLSRGVWPALLLSIPVVLWIWRRSLNSKRSVGLVALALVAAVLGAFLSFDVVASRLEAAWINWARLEASGEYGTQVGMRLAMWQLGYELWLDKPLLGHGAGAIKGLIEQGLSGEFGVAARFSHFHNFLLDELVKNGIAGLLALTAVFLAPLWLAVSVLLGTSSDNERFGATLIIFTLMIYFVSGMTGVMLGHDIMDAMFVFSLVVGSYLAAGRSVPDPDLGHDPLEAPQSA